MEVASWVEIILAVVTSVITTGASIIGFYFKLQHRINEEKKHTEIKIALMKNDLMHLQNEVVDLKKFIPDINKTLHDMDKKITAITTQMNINDGLRNSN